MIRNHLMSHDPEGVTPTKVNNSGMNNNISSRNQPPLDLYQLETNSMDNEDNVSNNIDPWYIPAGSSANSTPIASSNPYPNFNLYDLKPAQQNMNQVLDYSLEDDYDNEPPLLEELGIRFDHIWKKTQAVLYPAKQLSEHILDDADLAGPLFFCLLLGSCLLLSGKIHFGYIYGFSVIGCLGLQSILSLLHPIGLDFSKTCSVLGYCLLPVIALATVAILINLKGFIGVILSSITIIWSTFAATRLLDAKLGLTEQYWLVAYPVMLLYSCFVLITIF